MPYASELSRVTLTAAEFFAILGEKEAALDWLARAVRNGDERAEWFTRDRRSVSTALTRTLARGISVERSTACSKSSRRDFAAEISRPRRILVLHRFIEPCGHRGFQPSPKHRPGEPMKGSASMVSRAPTAVRRTVIRELLELIAALDRRVPQVQRAGEASIARDAAALKARALKRIEELEREPSSVTSQ